MRIYRAKTIITLGPSSSTPEILEKLMLSGVDIIRLNMSHGKHEEHKSNITLIRKLNEKHGLHAGIMCDLQGPKIRIGEIQNGEVKINDGETIIITVDKVVGTKEKVSCDYAGFANDVHPGDTVMIDDGTLKLAVKDVKKNDVYCEVIHGGMLKPHKGINLPDTFVNTPTLTEKDRVDLNFALEQEADFVAISFVRTAACIMETKELMMNAKHKPLLIPKIETKPALENIDEILDVSDGVLIARGDLGVELPPEEVPYYQNLIIRRAAVKKVPAIVATQMLDSMIHNFRPTRAEVSDVANAVYDGADVLMLSGETASGSYPLDAFEMLKQIILCAEASGIERKVPMEDTPGKEENIVEAIGCAVSRIAEEMNVKAVAAFTASGYTARIVSKYHIKAPIFGFANDERIRRRMNLYWGVEAIIVPPVTNSDNMIKVVTDKLLSEEICKPDDIVVITAGLPMSEHANTNFLKIHRL